MPSVQKWYFHNTTAPNSADGPGSTTISPATADVTATGASTNRLMNGTIGAGQTSVAITTLAQTTSQGAWFRRFISAPLAAQSIASGTNVIVCSHAGSESNANSDFFWSIGAWIYRPSTTSVVASVINIGGQLTSSNTEVGTTQTASTRTDSRNAVTVQNNDLFVVEMWRFPNTQAMGVAYTNTVFYDGTTEGSTTNIASFIDVGVGLELYVPKSLMVHGRSVRNINVRR